MGKGKAGLTWSRSRYTWPTCSVPPVLLATAASQGRGRWRPWSCYRKAGRRLPGRAIRRCDIAKNQRVMRVLYGDRDAERGHLRAIDPLEDLVEERYTRQDTLPAHIDTNESVSTPQESDSTPHLYSLRTWPTRTLPALPRPRPSHPSRTRACLRRTTGRSRSSTKGAAGVRGWEQ